MQLRKKDKDAIFLILLLTLTFSIYILYQTISIIVYIEGRPEDIIYKSNTYDKSGYKVNLKENEFISNIDNDQSYITSLTDSIKTSFNYQYIGNSDININYEYDIVAKIVSEHMGDNINKVTKPVWNKEFVLLDKVKDSSNKSIININKDIYIDIDYYNNLVETFRSTLNLPIISTLELRLNVLINGDLLNRHFQKQHYILITIPLGVKVFDVNIYKNFDNVELIYSKEQRKTEVSYMYAIIYILIFITNIWVGFILIKRIANKNKDKITLQIKKILKDYDERIVTVSNFVKYEKLEIVNVTTFEELLHLSEETLEPIIHWQRKKNEVWFSILRNKILYRYVFSY